MSAQKLRGEACPSHKVHPSAFCPEAVVRPCPIVAIPTSGHGSYRVNAQLDRVCVSVPSGLIWGALASLSKVCAPLQLGQHQSEHAGHQAPLPVLRAQDLRASVPWRRGRKAEGEGERWAAVVRSPLWDGGRGAGIARKA